MSTLLSEITNNYSGSYYIIEVPHQTLPNGYWMDSLGELEDEHDFHCRHVCETVEEIHKLTVATDGQGAATRHQAAKISFLAEKAIQGLFSDATGELSNRKLWADDITTDVEEHLKAEHGDGYNEWLVESADYAEYADHFDMSEYDAELYGVELMVKLLAS